MANADKCYLNIPFKEYLKDYDPEDPASRELAAGREFENYKAIERRINDPDCGGGCPCYRAWVESDLVDLSLVATTYVSALADINFINEEEGAFAISGGTLIGPAGLYWFALSAHFEDGGGGGGTDPVMAGVTAGNMQATGYIPDDFDGYVPLSGWTELPFQPLFSLQRNTAGTRQLTASLTAKLWRMCSCTPTPGGGGG